MKYKQGEKMIVEIAEVKENSYVLNRIGEVESMEAKIRRQAAEITRLLAENKRLKTENGNSLWNIEQARAEGQNEAWELVRKIGNMPCDAAEEIFGIDFIFDLVRDYAYQEAASKVARSEKAKEEIKVGDIVRLQEGSNNDLCILCKTSDEKYYNAVDKYGALYPLLEKEHFSKTGRHIDIDSFLKQIGEE